MAAVSAALLALVLCAAPSVRAVPEETATIPPQLDQGVREQIARQWGVRPEAVQLQWGSLSGTLPQTDDLSFRLLGRGVDGQFVVSVRAAAGRTTALSLRAGVLDTVMVATRPLRVGDRIVSDDIRAQEVLSWGAPATVRAVEGWEVLRSLAAGDKVAWPAAAPPVLVEGGSPVRLVWARGDIRITVAAVALHSARIGEPVRVRIPGRTGALEGTVTGPGLATLTRERES
jgi:flagella basal body P-ring formation protein FlgA